nr:hypothetical 12.8K protein - Rhizobium meliloti [Sinorhizobium meliloti]
MTLAAVDLLSRIKAANAAAFGGFDTLTIDHTRCGRGLSSLQFPCLHDEMVVDPVPQLGRSPFVEIALDSGKWREVLRQHPPLATGRRDVKQRVHHLTHIGLARSAKPTGRGHERRD